MSFLIAALRAIVEMLGLSLLALGFLHVISGARRERNPIYQLFALITRPPLGLVARLLPTGSPSWLVGLLCFTVLFTLWIGLALLRSFL
ncbi:MAG: hypothetical protein CVU34_11370 [Betaproteobacteria bacterium HGW-Betaproteobacteria-7]|jgi:uncharacterized protein YggT (Ycf19 family)|nr:MAG: hypothetical protein CVU34_11370 [Betaproteobacteria bacterium HGW-Betaproteobacteria-7]